MAASKRLLIWGAGGHGKVVADLVRASGHELVGFIDSDAAKVGNVVEPGGGRVLTDEASFLGNGREPRLLHGADAIVLAVGDNALRMRCLRSAPGLIAAALVHPSSVVSPSARISPGVVMFPNAVVNADAVIGEGTIVNSGAIVEHDCRIGACAHLSPRAVLAGRVTIHDLVWIGAGATVLPGVSIGAGAIVGAGAVVVSSLPANCTAIGVPAKVIKLRDPG